MMAIEHAKTATQSVKIILVRYHTFVHLVKVVLTFHFVVFNEKLELNLILIIWDSKNKIYFYVGSHFREHITIYHLSTSPHTALQQKHENKKLIITSHPNIDRICKL